MKRGPTWYKRYPLDFLGGVHALTAREIAVYAVTLDLIYQHGDNVDNSAKWISAHFSDLGAAAVRNALNSLISKGKLEVTKAGKLTNKRAREELKICG